MIIESFRKLRNRLSGSPRERIVSESDKRFYRDEGYLIIDTGVSPSLLEGVVQEMSTQYGDWSPAAGFKSVRKLDAWEACPSVRALAAHPKVLAVLAELYGRKPLPFQTLNFPVGTEQPAHSDTVHFNSKPSGLMAGVWVALEDIDENNGPLAFYPKSHKLPEYTLADVGVAPSLDSAPVVKLILEVIARERLEPKYSLIKKGQAVVWASNLIHGGAPQKDKSRSRHSQATHYFFEGADYYYTPLLSEPGKPFLRNPRRIS